MSTDSDWIILKKNINAFKGGVAGTWGNISKENCSSVSKKKYGGKNLFEFFLINEMYEDANTIAPYCGIFNDDVISFISKCHHEKYVEIVRVLSRDEFIIAYEDYEERFNSDTTTMTESSEYHSHYRNIMSSKFEKMIVDRDANYTLVETIEEFRFLSHAYLEGFYHFLIKLGTNSPRGEFVENYRKYLSFIPLIYRVINEYYLQFIKYQIDNINDLYGSSLLILSERFEDIKKFFIKLPRRYVDYRYLDTNKHNIPMYLAYLPVISEDMNLEVYLSFLYNETDLPLFIINNNDESIFHILVRNKNSLFLKLLLEWIKEHSLTDQLYDTLNHNNNDMQNVYDIALVEKDINCIPLLMEFMPSKYHKKLNEMFSESGMDMIDRLPSSKTTEDICINSLNTCFREIEQMKKHVLYDMISYKDQINKILKLVNKCSSKTDLKNDFYLDWLAICIINKEIEIFKILLKKYFPNDDEISRDYLNKIIPSHDTTLISLAIRNQHLFFIKSLLFYNIELNKRDLEKKTAFAHAVETKNLSVLKLLRDSIIGKDEYYTMIIILDNYIDILENTSIFNSMSFMIILRRLWNTIEYVINELR